MTALHPPAYAHWQASLLTVLSGSTLAELRTTLEAALGTSSPLTIPCGQPIETDADLSLLIEEAQSSASGILRLQAVEAAQAVSAPRSAALGAPSACCPPAAAKSGRCCPPAISIPCTVTPSGTGCVVKFTSAVTVTDGHWPQAPAGRCGGSVFTLSA
jgi:hypothetical protein